MMRLFVENQVPLPEALRLTAGSLRNADLAATCRAVAAEVEGGRVLSESLAGRSQFPARLTPLIEWVRPKPRRNRSAPRPRCAMRCSERERA